MNSTPDYGEPWSANGNHVYDRDGHHKSQFNYGENARRTAACVSACAGMADPEKEIAAMSEAIREAHAALGSLQDLACDGGGSDAEHKAEMVRTNQALAKLQPFITP